MFCRETLSLGSYFAVYRTPKHCCRLITQPHEAAASHRRTICLTRLQRPLKLTIRSQRHVLLFLLEAQKKRSAANSWFKDTCRDLTTMPLFCQVISTTLQTTAATALRQNDEGLQITAVWFKNADRLPTRCNQSDSHCTNESNSPAIEDWIQLVCTYYWFTCVKHLCPLHSHVWTTVKCITSLCVE